MCILLQGEGKEEKEGNLPGFFPFSRRVGFSGLIRRSRFGFFFLEWARNAYNLLLYHSIAVKIIGDISKVSLFRHFDLSYSSDGRAFETRISKFQHFPREIFFLCQPVHVYSRDEFNNLDFPHTHLLKI